MTEEKIKHLEFLQNNINRMNQCSFQIKSLAVTIVAAFLAIYAASIELDGTGNKLFIIFSVLPTITFWILDTFYLVKEKNLITTYNITAGIKESDVQIAVFDITPKLGHMSTNYFKVLFSFTEVGLYGAIIVVVLLITYIL